MSQKGFCRLCLVDVHKPVLHDWANGTSLRKSLMEIFPGMNLDLTPFLQLCIGCTNSVNFLHTMRKEFVISDHNVSTTNCKLPICKLCHEQDMDSIKTLPAFITQSNINSSTIIKEILESISPLMKFEANEEVICGTCWSWILRIYDFKRCCIACDEILKIYCSRNELQVLTQSHIGSFLKNLRNSNHCYREFAFQRQDSIDLLDSDDEFNEEHERAIARDDAIMISDEENEQECTKSIKSQSSISIFDEEEKTPIIDEDDDTQEGVVDGIIEGETLLINDISDICDGHYTEECNKNNNKELATDVMIDLTYSDSEEPQQRISVHKSNWACHICPQTYSRKEGLINHLLVHENPVNKYGRFSCKFCPYKNNWKGSVTRHETVHKVKNSITAFENLKYMCVYCNRLYKVKTDVLHHLEKHVKTWNKLQCTMCLFTCEKGNDLRFHYRVQHRGEEDPNYNP
ncbi:serendipity locus protein delta-like [Euwallacea similis]|uniref:serendipity locus protein delta-like n=1 Tax=Euwallacea similis TaxID=1736056 RepID=UPI00344B3AD6